MDVYVGDVLDKPNDPDPTLCVGENQSNVLRTQPPMTFALNSLPSLRFGCGSNMHGVNTSSEEPPSYQHSYVIPLSSPSPPPLKLLTGARELAKRNSKKERHSCFKKIIKYGLKMLYGCGKSNESLICLLNGNAVNRIWNWFILTFSFYITHTWHILTCTSPTNKYTQ